MMPRAENRKRPPNSLGNVPGGRIRNKSDEVQHGMNNQHAQNQKQALLEKMRKAQENKKADSTARE